MTGPAACDHPDFHAAVKVNRVEEKGVVVAFTAELSVECRECGQPFEFRGMRAGLSFNGPTCSFDGMTATLPVKPYQGPSHGSNVKADH